MNDEEKPTFKQYCDRRMIVHNKWQRDVIKKISKLCESGEKFTFYPGRTSGIRTIKFLHKQWDQSVCGHEWDWVSLLSSDGGRTMGMVCLSCKKVRVKDEG